MTASTVEKWREDRQGGAPWLEEVEREILASGIGNPPKTDSSTAVVRGANPKKVNSLVDVLRLCVCTLAPPKITGYYCNNTLAVAQIASDITFCGHFIQKQCSALFRSKYL